jgi:hypothetical protein
MAKKKQPKPRIVLKPEPQPQMVTVSQNFIDQLKQQPSPAVPPKRQRRSKTCDYCGSGKHLTVEDIPKMSKDDAVIAARTHRAECEFITSYIRPLLSKARNLRRVKD